MASKKITITLSSANAWALELAASILKKPVAEIVSFCLRGSTNPGRSDSAASFFAQRVQPTRRATKGRSQ